MTKAQTTSMTRDLVAQYISNGGVVKRLKPGTPKDLKRMRYTGWLFGGKRTFIASVSKRNSTSELFSTNSVAMPSTMRNQ